MLQWNLTSMDTSIRGHPMIWVHFLRMVSYCPMESTSNWGSCMDTCHVWTPVMYGHLSCLDTSCMDTCHVWTPVMYGHLSCMDTFCGDIVVSLETGFAVWMCWIPCQTTTLYQSTIFIAVICPRCVQIIRSIIQIWWHPHTVILILRYGGTHILWY